MNREHKKMYKAGKLWLTAMIVGLGLMVTGVASADQVVSGTPNNGGVVTAQATTQTSNAAETNNTNVGHLDSATVNSSNLAGYASLNASGWHATDASQDEPANWMIIYNNTTNSEIGRQRVNSVARPDVQQAYSDVNGSLYSGFNQHFYIPDSVITNGNTISLVSRYSDDALHGEGNHTDYWFPAIKFDTGNYANLDNVSLKNNRVNVSGWHATNQGTPHDNHFVIAYDVTQHREIARRLVNRADRTAFSRPDVARVYPLVLGADASGFNVNFDLTPALLNDQVQFISRWSRSADGNSNYVDYWFAPQWLVADKSNRASLDDFGIRNGQIHVSGWHATNLSLGRNYHTIIIVNANTGAEIMRRTVNHGQRPDVARVYPSILTATDSGFDITLPLQGNLLNTPLRIISRWSATQDANENYVDYSFDRSINLDKQAAWLDSLTQDGATISLSGWHAADMSEWYPHHFIILFDKRLGREIGRREVPTTRSTDVANAYGNILNSDRARFSTSITVDPAVASDPIQVISRYSNSSNGEGNYVQQWIENKMLNTPKNAIVDGYLYDTHGNPHRIPGDANGVARLIADCVNNSGERTDLRRVQLAALYVNQFCALDRYTMSGPYYSKPYGVFIAHEYSCAGSTRALGLVLNDLGYSYQHANENKYTHQWNILMMDGRVGWADGQMGTAGYGPESEVFNHYFIYGHNPYAYDGGIYNKLQPFSL